MRIFRNIIYANTPTSKACTMWVFRSTVSDSVIGLSSRFRTLLNNAFSRPFFVFDLPRDHGVGDIVFVDVAHILDGFVFNDRRCGILDIAWIRHALQAPSLALYREISRCDQSNALCLRRL